MTGFQRRVAERVTRQVIPNLLWTLAAQPAEEARQRRQFDDLGAAG